MLEWKNNKYKYFHQIIIEMCIILITVIKNSCLKKKKMESMRGKEKASTAEIGKNAQTKCFSL
jgi:hypothetical protein